MSDYAKHVADGISKNEHTEEFSANLSDKNTDKFIPPVGVQWTLGIEEYLKKHSINDYYMPYVRTMKQHDPVSRPSHYTSGNIECIDAIAEAIRGLEGSEAYNTGAALKYLWRWKKKNGVEDLKKAKWHIERLISELEK